MNEDQRQTAVTEQVPAEQVTIRYGNGAPEPWKWGVTVRAGLEAVVRTAVVSGYRVEAHHWHDEGRRRLDIEIVDPTGDRASPTSFRVQVSFRHTETRRGGWVFHRARLHQPPVGECTDDVELPRVRDVCTALEEQVRVRGGDGA